MTLKHKAIRMYKKKQIITCDVFSYGDYSGGRSETLEVKIEGVWLNIKPPKKNYQFYSHAYSPSGLERLEEMGYFK